MHTTGTTPCTWGELYGLVSTAVPRLGLCAMVRAAGPTLCSTKAQASSQAMTDCLAWTVQCLMHWSRRSQPVVSCAWALPAANFL